MGLKSKPLDQVRKDVPVHEVMKDELSRVNLVIPESTKRSWKQASLNSGRSMTDLIVEAMANHPEILKLK
jgi:hypothetical protein